MVEIRHLRGNGFFVTADDLDNAGFNARQRDQILRLANAPRNATLDDFFDNGEIIVETHHRPGDTACLFFGLSAHCRHVVKRSHPGQQPQAAWEARTNTHHPCAAVGQYNEDDDVPRRWKGYQILTSAMPGFMRRRFRDNAEQWYNRWYLTTIS